MFVEVENYTKIINKQTVLDNINIKMDKGKVYGFKGKNASGKTMLMRAICGLIKSTKGHVVIDGEIIGKDRSFPKSVGVLIENPGFIGNYSGFENLKTIASIKQIIGDEKIKEILEEVGLNPNDNKKYKKYSLGMKQKLGIAAAIMEEPEIIILDEPTNGLDENGVLNLRNIIRKHKQRGALIIISSHDSEELNFLADEIFEIESGKIKNHIDNSGR
ncbi:MAG: ATP-binding cassette domain-containing protein [Lachnoclostridium sp.]|jgi:ABC-2 type transport system ATP-binding protein